MKRVFANIFATYQISYTVDNIVILKKALIESKQFYFGF